MSVPEIDNFRQKFPMYNDMSDIQVATKLAQKYPAYSDLPGKVAMVNNKSNPDMQGGAKSPANIKAQQDVKTAQSKTDALDPDIVGANFANARLLGIPGLAAGLMGNKIPQATTSGGKIVSDMADFAGGSQAVGDVIGAGKQAISGIKGAIKPFQESKNIEEGFNALKEDVGVSKKNTKGYLSDTISNRTADIKADKTRSIQEVNQDVSSRLEKIKNQQDQFEQGILNTKKTDFAKYMKENGVSWAAKGSEAYGKELDRITSMIPEDKPITAESVSNMLNNTVSKIDAQGIKSPMGEQVRALAKDYSEQYKTNEIEFGKLKNQLSGIYSHVSGSLKSGKYFESGDRVASLAKDDWINFIGNHVPKEGIEAYSKLQKNYSRFAQAKREIGSMFNPYSGEFNLKAGMASAKRIAEDNINEGTQKLMTVLDKGIPGFIPGMPKFSEKAQDLVKAGQQSKIFDIFPGLIKKSGYLRKESIGNRISDEMKNVTAWRKKYDELIEQEKMNQEAKDKIMNVLSLGIKPLVHGAKKMAGF